MTFGDFQTRAMALAFYPNVGLCVYPALGLAGEAGEFCEKVKKLHRDNAGQLPGEIYKIEMLKELGDVLWYVTACGRELGYSLEDIATACVHKLESRSARGKLGGSGDNR